MGTAPPDRDGARRWIIHLGHAGGRIVFDGTPADPAVVRSTPTGEQRAAFVGG